MPSEADEFDAFDKWMNSSSDDPQIVPWTLDQRKKYILWLASTMLHEGARKEWHAFGFKCLIRRTPTSLCLNGYVGLPFNHPLYEVGCDEIHEKMPSLSVHGGLTWSDFWPEEHDLLWYVGFDTAHYLDVMPFNLFQGDEYLTNLHFKIMGLDPHAKYRDMEYVKKETNKLALQLSRYKEG